MKFPQHHSALIVSSLVTVASFVGATAYTQNQLVALDAVSTTIETNAVPSIEYLTRAALNLRRIRELIVEPSIADGQDALGAARAELRDLEKEIARYLRLTPLPGELDLWDRLRAAVNQAIAVARAALQGDARDGGAGAAVARRELDAAFAHAGQAISAAFEFDVRESERLAREVRDLRASINRTIVLLDAVATLVAVFAAFVAYRASRQHDRLLQAHNTLLTARVTELDHFAGRVAHDVLSPLSVIGMVLAMLGRSADAAARSHIERGQRAMQRIQQLVDALLTFARAGSPDDAAARCRVEPVLHEIVADAAEPARDKDVQLVVEPCGELEVACSVGVVTSVVQNLIGNAIKYMDADRPVRVVTARARAAGRMVRLEVEDTGPGIAPGIQQRIFEPFVRGRHADVGGIGLGLATVKRLAEAHGGAAGVRPGQQNGAVFWIDLPAASGAAQRERPEKIGAGTGA